MGRSKRQRLTILQGVLGVVVILFSILTVTEIIEGKRGIREVENKAMATETDLIGYQEIINEMQEEGVVLKDPFRTDERDVNEIQYIGRINIPKIKVNESIVLGTSPDKLKKGVGIMDGSDIPLGNTGESSIIAGHRGYLWRSKFFWNLDKLEEGDTIEIIQDEQTLEYKVIKVSMVSENDVAEVMISDDRTLLALVTSKPLWVTKDRLLVEAELVNK